MIKRSLLGLMVGALGLVSNTTGVGAQELFGEQRVNQDDFIAIAAPGSNFYSLVILEQQSQDRPCWDADGLGPVVVEPLLLNFDFTGICGRSTDSNGYSVRIDGRDRYADYLLKIIPQQDEIQLVATPVKKNLPMQLMGQGGGDEEELIIGRTGGIANGFLQIELEPGWEFTKRTYEGKPLGHVYLSRGESNVMLSESGGFSW
jgi:hypothetical protein